MCEAETSGARADLLHNAALCYVADFQHRRSFEAPTQPGRSPSPGGPRGTKWRSQPRKVRQWPEPSLLCADGWCCDAKPRAASQRRTAVQRGLDRFPIMGGKGASATGWGYSSRRLTAFEIAGQAGNDENNGFKTCRYRQKQTRRQPKYFHFLPIPARFGDSCKMSYLCQDPSYADYASDSSH